jgi:hypothetical protein
MFNKVLVPQICKLFIFFLVLFLSIDCSKSNKSKSIPTSEKHLLIHSTGQNTNFCIYDFIKTGTECKKLDNSATIKCIEYKPEAEILDSSKSTIDILLKGLSHLELNEKQIKSKIKYTSFVAGGYFNKLPPADIKKIFSDLDNNIKIDEFDPFEKLLPSEAEILFAFNQIKSQAKEELALILFQPESTQIIYDFENTQKKQSIPFGYYTLYKTINEDKDLSKACRQPISPFFTSNSSSHVFCKYAILRSLQKKVNQENLFQFPTNKNLNTYAISSTWRDYLPKQTSLNIREMNEISQKMCKLTIDEILELGIKKKEAQQLCFTLSFKTVFLELMNSYTFKIYPKENYFSDLAISKEIFPLDCK